ncbi:taurine catabolism dioxygenase TauD [Flavobacterium sp. Fl-77]|uniref:L-lysine 4-hydroxylase n=1 Tax=Flavobacterium flavipigmentatum TaxID=2893884 RepID=A0AAJ2S9M6_9FLAO|nr:MULTISPECIES: taurine catabolism dioxygenase TauD [unclassified Flavobacterium]MDX6182898.1 taurine catabolism dioxygenase TauD [Flavobacterium sp. Fl-33]MDX6186351.1 taurine catabolism dioxygenase TauD [Flavobacterium sp. Fl-77]UFH37861.1 taurine catabolism dioxygenase TauD [Flavobacterium sp. F-70]
MKSQTIVAEERPAKTNLHFDIPTKPLIVVVTPQERNILSNVGNLLVKAFGNYENPDYIAALHLQAFQLLPERISRILSHFGSDFSANQYGAIVFQGLLEVDQEELGPTPPNWQETDYAKLNKYGFICSLLHGAVPSKPVQYYAQRKGGGLLHAVIPDEKMAVTQTGSGSKTDLYVHTEDAFLLHQADFLSFLYLRNEERVPSTLYSIRSHGKVNETMQKLFNPIYQCPKDANYSDKQVVSGPTASVLYGNKQLPFIRFDAAEQIFNENAGQTPEALYNLTEFWNEAKELINSDYIPNSGDVIFVNNHLCAHGRSAFVAGQREENGKIIKCERRQMLRMMSKTSLIHIRSVTQTHDPSFIMEEHLGNVFNLE